jgi:hypothetical protein
MAQLADVVAAGIRTGRGGMALTVLEGLTVLVDGALLQAMAEAPGSPCGADTGAGGPWTLAGACRRLAGFGGAAIEHG